MIITDALAFSADQWAHAIRPATDGLERLEAGNPGVEFGLCILVEDLESMLGALTPIAVHLPRIATDPCQMGL